ncbi:MAG: protein translocase subunit SecF [Gammaproteobacteria bacterium]|nr:protein translocase subunit SecF [Gammaproteobacteria bacterium]MBV9619637.1 protein translocase subunit SecF [Gammaproteobacteria bacterium]
MEFFSHQTNYPFMATRKVWYTLSALLIVVSLVSFFTRGLNLAIDFTGGVSAEVSFPQATDVDTVRGALVAAGFRDPQVQNFGSSRDIAIRLPPSNQTASEVRQRLDDALKKVNPAVQVVQLDVVGPQVGNELKVSAAWALVFTLAGIFLYIAFRFHTWRLSLGAILAVMHDPILVLGFFSVTQMSFDLAVVAAILAVIGYSLNDTVVVFDRIRERFEGNRRSPPDVVLDQSINQTLSRTIMTKVVTSIVVVALLFLGGPVLKGFSAALLIGIIAGTYSSIYISSAIALDCGLTAEHVFPSVKKAALDHLP